MKLTAQQEAFAQGIAAGLSQADAYRAAYKPKDVKPTSLWQCASKVAANVKVASRVESLKAALAIKALWSREQSVQTLADIAAEGRAMERVAAVKELNSMHGFNEPAKVDIQVSFPRVINVIAGRA